MVSSYSIPVLPLYHSSAAEQSKSGLLSASPRREEVLWHGRYPTHSRYDRKVWCGSLRYHATRGTAKIDHSRIELSFCCSTRFLVSLIPMVFLLGNLNSCCTYSTKLQLTSSTTNPSLVNMFVPNKDFYHHTNTYTCTYTSSSASALRRA